VERKGGVAKWFHRIGWTAGAVISTILPGLTAPLHLKLQFALSGMVSALGGFSITYSILGDKNIRKFTKRMGAAAAGLIGLIAGQIYRTLLLDPKNTTPTTFIMWVEFGLFCIAYAGIFALLAFAYRNGGLFILKKLGKVSIPDE